MAVMRRSTLSTRSARSTEKFSVAGASASATTMKSKMLQGSRKKLHPQAPIRIASSATNIASTTWSRATSAGPAAAMIAGEVSRPSVIAFTTIRAMMAR